MDHGEKEIEPFTEHDDREFWKKLRSRIDIHEAKKKRQRRIIRWASWTSAAVLVLLCSLIAYRYFFLPDVYHAEHRMVSLILNDGSKVTLFKGATLTIDKSFPSNTRDVFLEGNAKFEVTKSKKHPFIVHAGNYQAKVLGTVFNVIQNGPSFKIFLHEGKVQVSQREKPKESYMLRPNETFTNTGDKNIALILSMENKASQKKDSRITLGFTDLDLEHAIALIELSYGIKISIPPDRKSSKITFHAQDETAEKLIERISIQLNLNIKKIDANTFELEE